MVSLKDNRGNMPFAIIAVTILILSMSYGMAISGISDAEERTSDVTDELRFMNESVDRTVSFINRGMGELIVSTGAGNGTLYSKSDSFKLSSEAWMKKQFPCYDGDVKITPLGLDIELRTEALQTPDGGKMPTYLRAEGTVPVRFDCSSGTIERVLDIRSDGSCALPLVEEMGSLFEIGLQGEGSMLSQMMSYQLTALAQERVIRGYGSLAATGSMGTDRILTAEDVEKSYRSCVTAMELLYFRDSEEGALTDSGQVDLADLVVPEDDHLTIDLSAIYAQALISVTDELILQWNDYFYGNVISDFLDNVTDKLRNAWDSLVGFFTGKDTLSASPYIREIMERNGYSESDYRYLLNGKSVSYYVPETSIIRTVNGERFTVTVGGFNNTLEYPEVDILEWSGIRNFKNEYRTEHNFIHEWTRGILNSAAVKVGTNKSLGQVSVPVAFDDDVTFTEDIMSAVKKSLSDTDGSLERAVENSIEEQEIYDPFYSAICKKISKGFDSAFGLNELENRMSNHPELEATEQRLLNSGLDPEDIEYMMSSLRSSLCNESVLSAYRAEAEKMLERFDVLLQVPGGQSGLIKEFLSMIGAKILPLMSSLYNMQERMVNLCEEMCDNMDLSPYSGLTELPKENWFLLENSGVRSKEFITVSDKLSPKIEILGPDKNPDECIHYVGFNERKGAAYYTVFRIVLMDEVKYSAEGAGTEAVLLNMKDSFISGTVPIHVDLSIPVVSGWELSGVYGYKPSTTFLNDFWKILLDVLEPVLKPLRELLKIINEVISIVGPALMEIANYAAAVVEKLYNAIIGPMMEIRNFVESQLSALLNQAVGGFANMVDFIFRATLNKQTVGISFLGMTLKFSTDIASFMKNVKNVLIIELSGNVSGLKVDCDMTIHERITDKRKDSYVTSGVRIAGEDWDLKMRLDPMMKTGNQLASLSGVVRNISLDVVFPHAVQYREAGVKLSDLDGIGNMLSNIPLPVAGMKGSLDAGLELKYDIPFKTGVVVNEFESNPPGNDIGNEWVELYNASGKSVDITGYTLVAGSDKKTKRMTLEEKVLSPRELYVINLERYMVLINDKNDILNGECVILLDREGTEIDRSIVGKDRENNCYTWQRVADGAVDWVFAEGTPGTQNCGGFVNGEFVKGTMKNIFRESAIKTMSDMGGLLDGTEDLSEFMKRAMRDAIDTTIEQISSCLIEASVFVSFDVSDIAGTTATGFKMALSVNTKTVSETIKYLVGEIESLLFNMENPYGIDGRTLPYENIHLCFTVHTGVGTPGFLDKTGMIPKIDVGVRISSNLSGLYGLLGKDMGRWSVCAGIVLEDCPSILLPSVMAVKPNMQTDLWLVKAVIGQV